MTTNNLTSLDFDGIIADLRTFYQGQTEFSDYNYQGSGLSQLLNILAYNSSNQAYLANASINEVFIDSAVKRGSAVSRAKDFNYCPTSATSAMGIVNITIPSPITTTGPINLPQYTPFTTNLSTGSFTFYNRVSATAFPVNGQYVFPNVQIYEGVLVTNSFTVTDNSSVSSLTFTLPNSNIDTASIQIFVQNSNIDSTTTKWNFTDDYTTVSPISNTYFIQANSNEQYQIQFGDGVLGALLNVGNIVVVTYQVCSTTEPNTVSTFPQTFSTQSIAGNTGLAIGTVQNSIGGAEEESIDEIKFNAPISMAANNRAVTEDDYNAIITKFATTVSSVNVYGGEKANPPVYGKVFITLEPATGFVVSQTVKDFITNTILANRSMLTIIPEYIDPDYTFLTFTDNVLFDNTLTTLSASDIQSSVNTTISNYINTNLGGFNENFYFSQLSTAIDNTNDSILGNTLTFNMQKRFSVSYGAPLYTTCNFNSTITHGSLYTNCFTYYFDGTLYTAFMIDDNNGNLSVVQYGTGSTIVTKVGTVNYTSGTVALNGLIINSITGIVGQLLFNVAPIVEVSNVLVGQNQILKIDDSVASVSDNVFAGITVNAAQINQATA